MARARHRLWVFPAAVLLAVGCSDSEEERKVARAHVDRQWFRRSLVRDNLEHWLAAAPAPGGFFASRLDRQWRPARRQRGTLVSQSRLIFVMAAGHDVTGRREYLRAAREGADFLLESFHDDRYGGWFWSVSPTGNPGSRSKSAYGHAFVIFGLSHAARVTGDRRYLDAADYTWRIIKRHLRDEHGGIRPGATRDWTVRPGGNTQNPIMHLFEALLALHEAGGSEEVFEDAARLATFVFGRLYQPDGGYLPEMYTAAWAPRSDARGGYVDVGHQFEWAFLLARAVEKGFPHRYLVIGNRLLDFGMRAGYDADAGGIRDRADYDGRPRGGKHWWQQAEHLRAIIRYATRHGRDDLWGPFETSLAFAREQLIDSEHGGWFTAACPPDRRGRRGSGKGGVWKVGYHETGMYLEALRATRKD